MVTTVKPPIKDTPNKGHNRNNLRTEITSEQRTNFNVPTKWRLSCSSNTLLTSDKGQPLNEGQNGQKTIHGPVPDHVIQRFHCSQHNFQSVAHLVKLSSCTEDSSYLVGMPLKWNTII